MPSSDRQVSPRSTADASGLEVFGLDPTLLPQALAIRDWLLAEAAQLTDPGQIPPGFAERMIALGVPIDRIMSAIHLLHSEYSGVGRFWTKDEGMTCRLFPHGPNRDRVYNESLCQHGRATRQRGHDQRLRQEARPGIPEATREPPIGSVLKYPAACGGDPLF